MYCTPTKEMVVPVPKASVMKLQLRVRPTFAARPHALTRASCLGPTSFLGNGCISMADPIEGLLGHKLAKLGGCALVTTLIDKRTHLHTAVDP